MKPQEAIDILKIFTTDKFQRCTSSEFDDAIYTAIEALEKQEPKKLTNNSWTHYHCPVCMKSVNSKYCGNCGQAILWEDCD